jgi:hypothetical protein
MGKIQAGDIHAGAQQFFDDAVRLAGGTDSANYFRVTEAHGWEISYNASGYSASLQLIVPVVPDAMGSRIAPFVVS